MSPESPAARAPREAVSLDVRALGKSYDVGPRARPLTCTVLHDVTLTVRAGECLALVGGGLAARTLLRCAAGLAHPSAGTIAWRDATEEPTAAPARAMVPADWCAAAGCLTVGDVLEAAAPRTLWQHEADARVRTALDLCALGGALRRPVAELPSSERWLVGLGVAVASGARWLFLEPPPTRRSRAESGMRRGSGGTAARRRAALLGLRASGRTVVASVVDLRAVPATRALVWRDGRLSLPGASARDAGAPWRVAEPGGTRGEGRKRHEPGAGRPETGEWQRRR